MAKAILTTKVDPTYDDRPEERYHFPRTYLRQVEAALGDWIIYYEPRRASGDVMSRGGRQAYFATARLDAIIPDPVRADHFYALVSDYLEFEHAVPFREADATYEGALTKSDGSTNKGQFGRVVRKLPDFEYDRILQAGLAFTLGREPRMRPDGDVPEELVPGFAHPAQADYEVERRIVEQLVSRPFRERAFSTAVKAAYIDTCAMTGLKIINGGGRSEVQAAHIRPVADRGPDAVSNGLALSATIQWMFDRGLVSVDDDYSLLIAGNTAPDTVSRLLVPERKLRLPARPELWPAQKYLDYHRQHVFKG
ncbi:HNH endonuclease [Oryzibacter oryziterrae]|uniref:HNH endonuclease n=1 Tax=Oryzibacter oryziterrae TaxID=2766474 RepID=UPI001F209595|nr:HNH endonuclease [Oryzibacter oryziterrae]